MSVSNRLRLAAAVMTCGAGLLTPTRADAVLVPSDRFEHAMAAEPGVGGKLIMFGGLNRNARPNFETWAWNGSKWSLPAIGLFPPARYGHAMATDKATGTVVMFGGFGSDDLPLRDTWVWTPADRSWSNATPLGVSPEASASDRVGDPITSHLTMAYDGVSKRVVLVMGPRSRFPFDATRRDPETWTWNGVDRTWTRELTPSPTEGPMAYDAAHSQVVLFGSDGRTWTWSGSTRVWTLRAPDTSPEPLAETAMAFDAKRNRVVLFGGEPTQGGFATNNTWTWDGNTWTIQQPSARPGNQRSLVMAYHAGTERVVENGAYNDGTPTVTWGYTKTWTQLA